MRNEFAGEKYGGGAHNQNLPPGEGVARSVTDEGFRLLLSDTTLIRLFEISAGAAIPKIHLLPGEGSFVRTITLSVHHKHGQNFKLTAFPRRGRHFHVICQ